MYSGLQLEFLGTTKNSDFSLVNTKTRCTKLIAHSSANQNHIPCVFWQSTDKITDEAEPL